MNDFGQQLTVLLAHPSADLYGSDRVLLETAKGLQHAGARVAVTIPEPGPLVAELKKSGVAVVLCPTPVLRKSMLSPRGMIQLALTSVRDLFRGIGVIRGVRPDVILANTITIPLWTAAGRLTRTPVVTHVHEAEANTSRAVRIALALPLIFSHAILANSRFSSRTLEGALPALNGRSTVIYNGIPGPRDLIPPRTDLDGGLRILYVGRLSHRKGVDIAVDALIRLVRRGIPAQLSLVGAVFPGYEDYERALRDQVRTNGVESYVTFHGFQNDVWPFLAQCDVAVVPSRLDEPFGNTAVEALLASRPVIVSNTSGLREAAADYRSVQFVDPGDPEQLAAALETVVAEWETIRRYALLDAEEAESRHRPDKYGASMAAHLAKAAARYQ